MRRVLLISVLGMMLTSSAALAADRDGAPSGPPIVSAAPVSLAPRPDATVAMTHSTRMFELRRPMVLPALYGASALLQGYDAYSTLTVLKHGGVEANPVMQGITRSPAAFIGLKAGVTMMSIMAAERMWKSHNRIGAVATMLVSNGLMTMVAANNARVLSRVK